MPSCIQISIKKYTYNYLLIFIIIIIIKSVGCVKRCTA